MTETEALDAIAALDLSAHDAEQVRAVLARVGSGAVPPTDIDHDALRRAVQSVLWNASNYPRPAQPHMLGQDITPLVDRVVSAVADTLVRPVEGVVIDRDALIAELRATVQRPDRDRNATVVLGSNVIDLGAFADRVLALVRPAEGIVLTTDEARLAHEAVKVWTRGMPVPWPSLVALAEKLETMAQGGQ